MSVTLLNYAFPFGDVMDIERDVMENMSLDELQKLIYAQDDLRDKVEEIKDGVNELGEYFEEAGWNIGMYSGLDDVDGTLQFLIESITDFENEIQTEMNRREPTEQTG